jgi:glycosyltransferase involved in cell wall biosynthesis
MSSTDLTTMALVIVPTYNEADNIARLVGMILQQDAPLHVVVVDDNSPDGTGQVADRLATADARVSVIHRAGKLGLGTAYIAGFRQALTQGYGYAITMDADFSHSPNYLPGLLRLAASHDLTIGSRYVPGGGTEGWPLVRRLLSRGANAFARAMLSLHAHDCTAGFRCYRRAVLENIELETIFSSGYSFLVEMVTRCERRGYRVGELPIIFRDREAGASKVSGAEIYRSVYTILRLRFQRLPWERWSRAG